MSEYNTEFDFDIPIVKQEWWIRDILPKGAIVGVIAPSMSAKSTLVSGMFMSLLCDSPFLGMPAEGCDVLLIDQDSQEIGLKNRLKRMQTALGTPVHRFYLEYMNRRYFKDSTLLATIRSYPTAKVVVMDAFNKIGGLAFDYNGVSEVARAFEQLKTNTICGINQDRTLVVIHHANEKREGWTADDYISTDDHSAMAMGSSAFVESLDCYYIVATPDKGKIVKKIYVRPVSKRVLLPADPFVVEMEQNDDSIALHYSGRWKPEEPEIVKHILLYFTEVSPSATINELIAHFGGQYKYKHFYNALRDLRNQGRAEYSVEASDRFRWRYVDNDDNKDSVFSQPPTPDPLPGKLKTNKTNKTRKTVKLFGGKKTNGKVERKKC